jgi:hypothetical protein
MYLTDSFSTWLGRRLAEFLNGRGGYYKPFAVTDTAVLRRVLRPADVLLVEGDRRVSIAIKYLTQSCWSHACLYVGDALAEAGDADPPALIEADICDGVVAVPLSHYAGLNTRICRPIGLSESDAARVVEYAVGRLGDTYDMKNVIDLVRYLLPEPPVPARYRRRMLAFGSGDPTRAICSTLVAQAFQSIRYPILPRREEQRDSRNGDGLQDEEILRVRHFSHFTPRDFDLSPYFQVVKPLLDAGFDFHKLKWSPDGGGNYPAHLPEATDSEVLGVG